MLRNRTPPEELITLLEHFIAERENMEYKGLSEQVLGYDELKIFETKWPKLHTMLCRALEFRQFDVGDWRLDEDSDGDDSWAKSDPFTLSYSSIRIYGKFEEMLCPELGHTANCDCSRLQSHYGTCLFRCGHAKLHDRPFKCTAPTCTFATIGFQSQTQLQKHWARCHHDATPNVNQPIDDPDDNEVQPLLFDLVTMGKVDEVKCLLPRFGELTPEAKRDLVKLAAFTGPLAMVKLLAEVTFYPEFKGREVLAESMKGENMEVMNWATPKCEDFDLHIVHRAAMDSSADVFEHWKKHFSGGTKCCALSVISSIKNPAHEMRLSALWKERASSGELSLVDLGGALVAVALTSCSVALAKTLLECGADINFKFNRVALTPLHIAAAKSTAAAAKLMRFLLLSGADPNVSSTIGRRGRSPSMERGARNISKWLGMTWDQLVRWAEEQRRNGPGNDASF
ncbi:hypothetical protein GP486_003120 [Trichoglossum hirsutum]|uniref:Ankyrin n=1 Tax=Trichoglossum hirsutum TaxID=265104 RepID=A0A9P8LDW6_9PEZI|nr:hypothetical protein GP486_003120 [Trichoglossum hirsutum]